MRRGISPFATARHLRRPARIIDGQRQASVIDDNEHAASLPIPTHDAACSFVIDDLLA